MAFKMKNPSLMKMAKMAGNNRVAMKMKQQDAAMKMKKDPMKMKDPMDMKKDPMMMKKDPMMMKKGPMKMKKKKDPKRPVAEKIRETEAKPGIRKKGRTVTKTKTRTIDGATVTKTKGPGFREKSVMKMKKGSAMKMKKGSAMKKDDKFVKNNPDAKDPMEGQNFNPSKGKSSGSKNMKGGTKTFSQAQKDSKGLMNDTIKKQRAYEAKKKKENPNWNKREDNAWKARQNKINEYAGSKKRYEVKTGKQEDGSKVKQSTTNVSGGKTKDKLVIKSPTGDKDKVNVKKNEEGKIVETKQVKKDEKGTKKFKAQYDPKSGKMIRARGYSTKEYKKSGSREELKAAKKEAKKNRKELGLNRFGKARKNIFKSKEKK